MLPRRPVVASSVVGLNPLGRRFLRKQRSIVRKPKLSTQPRKIVENSATPDETAKINQYEQLSSDDTVIWSPEEIQHSIASPEVPQVSQHGQFTKQRTKADIEEAEMKSDFAFKTSWMTEVTQVNEAFNHIPLSKAPLSTTISSREAVSEADHWFTSPIRVPKSPPTAPGPNKKNMSVGKIKTKSDSALDISWLNEHISTGQGIAPSPLPKVPLPTIKSNIETVPIDETQTKSDFASRTVWPNESTRVNQDIGLMTLSKSVRPTIKPSDEIVSVGKTEAKSDAPFKTSWLNELVLSNQDIGPISLPKSSLTTTKSDTETTPEGEPTFGIKRLTNTKDSPAAFFQAHIDQGTADFKKAFITLDMAYKESMETFSDAEGMRRLGSMDVGTTVLNWLQSDHSIMPPEAFQRIRLTHMLVHALVAEAKEAILWQWWWETRSPVGVGEEIFFAWKMELMRAFVHAGLKAGGLDMGLMVIFKALRTKHGFGRLLFPCASDLVGNILELHSVELTDITLYNDFVTAKKNWSNEPELNGAILALCHPKQPDCDPALKLMANLKPETLETFPAPVRARYLKLCERLSSVLAARGSSMDAERVEQFRKRCLSVPGRELRAHAREGENGRVVRTVRSVWIPSKRGRG